MAKLTWVYSWPNQFIRLTHHAGSFLNDPYGIGAIHPYGSEALEAANSWLKRYVKYFTFRGNRKNAIMTVFKMRYLKSCYNSCGVEGHHRNSKLCISLGSIKLEEEDFESDQIFKRSLELIKHHSIEHGLGANIQIYLFVNKYPQSNHPIFLGYIYIFLKHLRHSLTD